MHHEQVCTRMQEYFDAQMQINVISYITRIKEKNVIISIAEEKVIDKTIHYLR